MTSKSVLDIIERGLRGNTIDDLVIGWSFRIYEVSSNVFGVEGMDGQGHHIYIYGVDPEKLLARCIKETKWIMRKADFLVKAKKKIRTLFKLKI